MASPARAIQRKRIHSLSTGELLAPILAAAVLVAGGCSSGGGGGTPQVSPVTDTVHLAPNTQGSVAFVVTRDGAPAAGQTVAFSLQPPSAAGATLIAPSAVTDANGNVSAVIRAGLATTFAVVAQVGAEMAQVAVIVDSGATGNVVIAPFFAPSSTPPPADAIVELWFYDLDSCSILPLDNPPQTTVGQRQWSLGVGETQLVPYVDTTQVSAAIAQVSSGSTVVAEGCIDIPGSSLQPGATVEVWLPLYDAIPDPIGTYSLTTDLTFAPPLAAAAALATPWTDLSDCPLDPAQRWLDFTVNSLSSATSADPLTLGQAIAARRGVQLVDGNGTPTACRSAHDGNGNESLDALALGLFGSPLPAPVAALPAIAVDAGSLLDSVRLLSTLAVAPSSTASTYVVTHTLSQAQLGPQDSVTVDLASLGLPTLQAFASATASDDVLTIGPQAFTLRLGTVARAAFGPLSLVPRGLPADLSSFVTALFALAQSPDGTATGCAALDGMVCPTLGESAGCLTSACEAGLEALVTELANGFASADGTGLDFSLSGSAPLIEKSGGVADRLGSDQAGSPQVATWSVNLRTELGSAQLSAQFVGTRN